MKIKRIVFVIRLVLAMILLGVISKLHAQPAPQEALQGLLNKLETEISNRQIAQPPNDNAIATWQQIAALVTPDHPEYRQPLRDFATHARQSSTTQTDQIVALEFIVFSDQAIRLSGGIPSIDQAPIREIKASQEPVQEPQVPSPSDHPVTVKAEAPTPVQVVQATDAMADLYAQRGDGMLAIKDISAARKFYEVAAIGGNIHAALTLAKTYNEEFLAHLGIIGLKPDKEKETYWTSKADNLQMQKTQNTPMQITGN